MKKRLSEEQIVGVLREGHTGANAGELCRRHGVSETTYYTWKAKYAGMTMSEVKKMKALVEENTKWKGIAHTAGAG